MWVVREYPHPFDCTVVLPPSSTHHHAHSYKAAAQKMPRYFGIGTARNRIVWTIFAVFLVVAFVMLPLGGEKAVNCVK